MFDGARSGGGIRKPWSQPGLQSLAAVIAGTAAGERGGAAGGAVRVSLPRRGSSGGPSPQSMSGETEGPEGAGADGGDAPVPFALWPGAARGAVREQYRVGARLASGTTSVVHEAVDRSSGARAALKVMDKRAPLWRDADRGGDGPWSRLVQELSVATAAGDGQCAHLLRCLQVHEDATHVVLAMELCAGGTALDALVAAGAPLPEEAARRIVRQVLSARARPARRWGNA